MVFSNIKWYNNKGYVRRKEKEIRKTRNPLLTKQLNIKILDSKILNPQIHKTLLVKREVDFLCEIKTPTGQKLLHIEFQSKNEPKMLNRIGEYHGFLVKKYNFPIRHVVIYLGAKKARMLTQLDANKIYSGFDLIDLSTIDVDTLLSVKPSKLALIAPLYAVAKHQKEAILKISIDQLRRLSPSDHEFREYLNRLFLLSGLRPQLTDLLSKIIDTMPITFDIVKHPLFQKGRAEGREKGKIESVLGLHQKGVSISIISEALNISERRIQEIIKSRRKH